MAGHPVFERAWFRLGLDSAASEGRLAGAVAVMLAYAVALAAFKWIPINDALCFSGAIAVVFWFLHDCSVRCRTIGLHICAQILVVCWLLHLWTLGYEGRNAVLGGILPWSDSFDYYQDSLRLMHGSLMEYAAKRPIFSVVLAGLLRLFDGNLQLPLLLLAMFAAWAIALASLEVWKSYGWRGALAVFVLALLSERQWAGFVQTENVGLPLGLIGFVLVWRANAGRDQQPDKAHLEMLAGLFAITVALMARAGPLFVLPALALWWARGAGAGRRKQAIALGACCLAIGAGYGVHESVELIAAKGGSFGDYPAIVYGLMHGQDYTLLTQTHPGLAALGGAARSHEAWRIVIAEAIERPWLVPLGQARSLAAFFFSPHGLFGFVFRNPDDIVLENGAALHASINQFGVIGPLRLWLNDEGLYSLLNAAAMAAFAAAFVVAAVWGMLRLCRRGGDRHVRLLRWTTAAAVLSVACTPPWITSSHQVMVAVLAFIAIVPVAAFGPSNAERGRSPASGLALFPIVAAAGIVAGAAFLRMDPVRPPACAAPDCHLMRVFPSTAVRVVGVRRFDLHDKARADLLYSTRFLQRHNRRFVAAILPYLNDGTQFVAAFDSRDGGVKYLVDDSGLLDVTNGAWQVVRADAARDEARVQHVTATSALPVGQAGTPLR